MNSALSRLLVAIFAALACALLTASLVRLLGGENDLWRVASISGGAVLALSLVTAKSRS